jgi:uncharacterized membrane protein (UPF0127 family)
MITRALYWFLRSSPYNRTVVRYKGKRIKSEVADTFAKQMVGLMYRTDIGKDEGMLFPLKFKGRRTAAVIMLNMRFCIDIVWIDNKHKIVDIIKNAKPSYIFGRSYVPKKEANYVLELKTGTAERLGMRTGEKMNF